MRNFVILVLLVVAANYIAPFSNKDKKSVELVGKCLEYVGYKDTCVFVKK